MIDLQKLRYFVAVAEVENVGRAAQLLNLTQSPLSRQIQNLETDLGVTLFHRSKKRLKLTAAGRELLVAAKDILSHGERIERRARALAEGSAGSLVIGYVAGAIHAGILTRWLRAFSELAPGVEIELKNLRSHEQRQQIAARELDVGFVYTPPDSSERLLSRSVYEEPFKLAVPRGNEFDAAPSAGKLSEAQFIAWPGSNAAGGRGDFVEACASAGFKPDIRYEVADPLAVLEIVSAGLGVAIVQASLGRIAPQNVALIDLPTGFGIAMTIHLVRAEECSAVAEKFFDLFAAPPPLHPCSAITARKASP